MKGLRIWPMVIAAALAGLLALPASAQSTFRFGDVNGDGRINIRDAMKALRIMVQLDEPISIDQFRAADVSPRVGADGSPGDGTVGVSDVIALLSYVVGLIPASDFFPPPVSIVVDPTQATVNAGLTRQFYAMVPGSYDTRVTWSVDGGSGNGTITPAGLYTAPKSGTIPRIVTIRAASVADPSKVAAATVTIAPPATIAIDPTAITVEAASITQFTASVANDLGAGVHWQVVSGGGVITSSGLYQAPLQPGAAVVQASSVADPTQVAQAQVTIVQPALQLSDFGDANQDGKRDSADVTIVRRLAAGIIPAPPVGSKQFRAIDVWPPNLETGQIGDGQITNEDAQWILRRILNLITDNDFVPVVVKVDPPTTTINAGANQAHVLSTGEGRFTAITINDRRDPNDPNKLQGVDWFVNGIKGGNSTVGTIQDGVYLPPDVPPSDPITITAVSKADQRRSATAKVNVNKAIVLHILPRAVQVGPGAQVPFTAQMEHATPAAMAEGVTWILQGPKNSDPSTWGTLTPTGPLTAMYVAPASVTKTINVDIKVVAKADGKQSQSGNARVILNKKHDQGGGGSY